MAMVALQKIIWQSQPVQDKDGNTLNRFVNGVDTGEPDLERVEIPNGSLVPKVVPLKIQQQWLNKGWVREDPSQEMPDKIGGPPNMLLPISPHAARPVNRLTPIN